MKKFNLFIIAYVFCFIYYPPFFGINILHFLSSFAWLMILFQDKFASKVILKSKIAAPFFILMISICYSLTIILIESTSLLSIYGLFLLLIEIIPCSIYISMYCIKKRYTYVDILRLLLIVGTIQGVISLVTFVNPNIHNRIVDYLVASGYTEIFSLLKKYRLFGFAGNLTFTMPIVQAFLAIMSIYLAITFNFRYFFYAPLLIFSGIINARNAMVVLLIGLCIMGLYLLFLRFSKGFKRLAVVIIPVIILLPILSGIIEIFSPQTFNWIKTGFEEIKAFTSGDNIGYFSYIAYSKPLQHLQGLDILFGKGYFILGNKKGISSDIGFYNDIWFGGIIYAILIYSAFMKIVLSIFRIKTKQGMKFLASFMGMTLILANIKGPVFKYNELVNLSTLLSTFLAAKYSNNHLENN